MLTSDSKMADDSDTRAALLAAMEDSDDELADSDVEGL